MLDQLKRKRLNLTHSFENTRPRVSSTQKRKQIEANLAKFQKEVRESRPFSPLNSGTNNSQKKQVSQQLSASPTMRDIPIASNKLSDYRKISEQIESPRFKQSKEERLALDDHQKTAEKYEEAKVIIEDSPSSPKKIEPQQQSASQKEKLERQVSFGGNQLQEEIKKAESPEPKENSSDPFQPSYEKNEDKSNELNFNYNQSNYGSSNGSSAIFFTSQFRDYINREKPEQSSSPAVIQQDQPKTHVHKKSEPSEHQSQNQTYTDKQIGESFLKMGEEQISDLNDSRSKKLAHNQSGRSLAFSNNDQSMLRDSKANQYVHDLVNKKLDEELVLEISHFGRNKFKDFIRKYDELNSTNPILTIAKQLKLIHNLIRLQKKAQFSLKRYYFDGFLIMKQYRFEQVKNQIKADNFHKEACMKLLRLAFEGWKHLGLENQKKSILYMRGKDEKMRKNIFQVFKMIWFDAKVKHQVDLYYLSKIFSSFKNTVAISRKKSENQALKQYCRWLRRRYFEKLQEGTDCLKRQRLNQEMAQEHYQRSMMKKCFDAWVGQCSMSPQYVSLTMTSKNVFKQSADNKWLGIRTVDFKQIKQ